MKKGLIRSLQILLLILCILQITRLVAVQPPSASPQHTKQHSNQQSQRGTDDQYSGKQILWVSSYHRGYEANDDMERGIRSVLCGSGVTLHTFFMDTKRHDSKEFGEEAGRQALEEINTLKPDLIIASDDNAQKYLVVPYLKDAETPVVFCGVNWDAGKYGYPTRNITGMVEVDLAREMYDIMHRYAKGDSIGFLSGDVESERAMARVYNKRFFDGKLKLYLVNSMARFKETFLKAQQEVDMLYFYNYAGIQDWNPDEAELFLSRHTRIPTGSHNGFMAPFVTFVAAKSLEEHGEYAARTALRILAGTSPADIPLTRNTTVELYANMRMAKAASTTLPISLLQTATVIKQDEAYLDPAPQQIRQDNYRGRKIFFLDSYHESYLWSRGVEQGIRSVLYESGAELKVFHMDTKRKSESDCQSIGKAAFAAIQDYRPDVVIASDDNAQKYVIVPYLTNTSTPVVFCGVNWNADQYGYPAKNITGMLEVEPVMSIVNYMQPYARGKRVGYIGGNVPTQKKVSSYYSSHFFQGALSSYLVSDMQEFRAAVLRAQQEVDMLIVSNNAGIAGWQEKEVQAFMLKNNTLPTGSFIDFMSPYVIFTVAKVAEEQGNYAAQTSLKIIDGTPPATIPIAANRMHRLTLNLDMAAAAAITLPYRMLKGATVIDSQHTATQP